MKDISEAESRLGRKSQNNAIKSWMKRFKVDYYNQGSGSDDKGNLFEQHNLKRRRESGKQEETGPGNK